MQRIYVSLALLAIVACVIVGCGGGGSNGGGDGTIGTTALSGRVIGTSGNALSGATVTITASGRTPISATTNGEGEYTMSNVPTNLDFTLTVTESGTSARTWTGMRLNTINMPSGARMHIALAHNTLPNGSVLSIRKDASENGGIICQTLVTGVTVSSDYPVVWTIVGNIPSELRVGNSVQGLHLYLHTHESTERVKITATGLSNTTPVSATVEHGGEDDLDEPPGTPLSRSTAASPICKLQGHLGQSDLLIRGCQTELCDLGKLIGARILNVPR